MTAQLENSLRALAAELKRNEGFTSWLTGSTQHADVKSALDAAFAKLRGASKEVDGDDDLARPFLLACATRQAGLCALGFSSLQQLAATKALSPASMHALVTHLAQVDDGDDEQAQLKALQTTLTVLQAPVCSNDDAAVLPLLVVCFRLLSGAQASNAVHATAAATLRQAVSVVLQRASDESSADVAAKAAALLRGLCTLARGGSSSELNAPLPRAFAVDLLDDALRAHVMVFSDVAAFKQLLIHDVFPLLTELLASSGAVPLDGVSAQPSAATASAVLDEVGIDPAEVAERRCALRAATTMICSYAFSLPEQADALLERVLSTTQSALAATWYRASAFEALQRCAADLRLARSLAQSADGARAQLLCRIATTSSSVLTDVFGAEAELNTAEGVLQAMSAYFDARSKGREVTPDVDNDDAQRAHVACLALDCIMAQCNTAAHLAETPDLTTLRVAVDVSWQPLLSALSLALSRAQGENIVVATLKAHTSLTCAAASAGNEHARDACLQCLCQLAQAAADSPVAVPDALDTVTPRLRRARSSVAAAVAPELSPRALHCMRALLNCVLALASELSYAGWCPVLNALSRVDAALEVDRTGTERATLAAALDQLYAHIAMTLPSEKLDAFVAGLRQISQREVQDADTASALLSAPGRRGAEERRLYMLSRHSGLTLAAPQQLPHLWLGLEQHLLATLACDAAPVRAEATAVFGHTLLGLLDLPAEHLASHAADEAARLHGQPTFTSLLVSAFERAAAVAPPDKDDVREVLLRLLLDVLERHSELLGAAWLAALHFITSSAREAEVRAEAAASTAVDEDESVAYTPLASGFACATALVQHLLPNVPPEYRGSVVDTLAAFGHQQADVNTALSAVGLIWDIADYSAREEDDNTGTASIGTRGGGVLQVLSAVFSALASLSRDSRPEIRNSAVRALATAQLAHAQRLPVSAAHAALWELLLPAAQFAFASTSDNGAGDSGGGTTPVKRSSVVIMLHHSRNTATKQWEETLALCLGGLARVLRVQLATVTKTPEFEARWSDVLSLVRDAAVSPSREVGLAAVACLGAIAASGALERKAWTQLLLVFERVAGLSACEAVRTELPAALSRLYAAQKTMFQSSDIDLLLRVADVVARMQPPAGSRALVEGELTTQQTAALDLIRALLPLEAHAATQYSTVFRVLATHVRDAAASAGIDKRLRAGAGYLSPTYGKHAIELIAALYEPAPLHVRADALPEIAAAYEAAGGTQNCLPAAQMWLAALLALPVLLREGPAALHESAASRDAAASEVSWHALLLAAQCLLRFDVDDSVRCALVAESPATSAASPVEKAYIDALDAVVHGALGSVGIGTSPPAVVDGFVSLVEASAQVCGSFKMQAVSMEQLCTQKLAALVAASSGSEGGPGLAAAHLVVVASHALPALLRHCTALLARCVVAEAEHADGRGALPSQAQYGASVSALETLAQLRPSTIAIDAAVLDARQAGRREAAAAGVLVTALRAAHMQASPDRAHLLLLYGPLVQALAVRNAQLRAAVAELLATVGGVLSLLPDTSSR